MDTSSSHHLNTANSRTSSRHRPASFLGSYLDSVEMDPDLMLGAAAAAGGHFQPLQWDYPDFGVEDDDGEGERLLLRRMPGRMGRASVDDDDDDGGGSNVAIFDRRYSCEREVGQKRRWSTRLSETIFDFGKKAKERAGSFAWRRDSVQLQVTLAAQSSGRRSSEVAVGSGERSRDGDDELSFVDLPLAAEQRRRAFIEARTRMETQRVEYLYPVDVRDHLGEGESSSAVPGVRMSFQSVQFGYNGQDQLSRQEREHLAMLEDGVRMADRQGAFSETRRARMFSKAWAHRTTDVAQAKASVQYRSTLR